MEEILKEILTVMRFTFIMICIIAGCVFANFIIPRR